MDTFTEMIQKMTAMSDADRELTVEKYRSMCTCGACPTFDDCARGKSEALYCIIGRSPCTLAPRGCLCPTCPVTPIMGLAKAYYCRSGSEKEIRKM